ncbi:protein-L-isoaspartate O-methyltransferase family protein [Acetobacter okinawensis]|uniref:protein-L-isoaspartate O-methyltransferase family protein n=1 Tax=Acetobacter okinawensis TaxID=1076594 RepID=UPI0004712DC3|nr:protein-L-isoaspartate O-methyltransferase [Acetobacter okinawensis]
MTATATHQGKQSMDAALYAEARHLMVDDQLRPSEITDSRILDGMRTLPRELCVRTELRNAAYADTSLPLSQGRVLPQPLLAARLVQAAVPSAGQHVLVVGAATGYTAALFAYLGLRVTALESDTALIQIGQSFCNSYAPDVVWQQAPLSEGAAASAPYDLIYFDGCIATLPDFCDRQLAPQGRIVGLLQSNAALPEAFSAIREPGYSKPFRMTFLFEAQAPLLPGMAPERAFSF